jgi:hypothetical protein
VLTNLFGKLLLPEITDQLALAWSQKILALSLVIQTTELLIINNYNQVKKVWCWPHLQKDWQFKTARWLASFCLTDQNSTYLLILRLLLAVLLFFSNSAILPIFILVLSYLVVLRFRGPFNGGSDYMTIQLLLTLSFCRYTDDPRWHLIAIWYLSFQVVLSYFIAGWVKIKTAEWRSGFALSRFVLNSNYRVPEFLKRPFANPIFCIAASWSILLFECLFPIVLIWPQTVLYFTFFGLIFHVLVFIIFGLNRFVWAWFATYPILLFCCYNSIIKITL